MEHWGSPTGKRGVSATIPAASIAGRISGNRGAQASQRKNSAMAAQSAQIHFSCASAPKEQVFSSQINERVPTLVSGWKNLDGGRMKIWRIRYSDRNSREHSLYQEQDSKPTEAEALEIIRTQLSNCADGILLRVVVHRSVAMHAISPEPIPQAQTRTVVNKAY